jgi:hypothetical protein
MNSHSFRCSIAARLTFVFEASISDVLAVGDNQLRASAGMIGAAIATTWESSLDSLVPVLLRRWPTSFPLSTPDHERQAKVLTGRSSPKMAVGRFRRGALDANSRDDLSDRHHPLWRERIMSTLRAGTHKMDIPDVSKGR